MNRDELRKTQGANNPRYLRIEEMRNSGLTWKEIAEQVGTTPQAAYQYLRILKATREIWKKKGIPYYDTSTSD